MLDLVFFLSCGEPNSWSGLMWGVCVVFSSPLIAILIQIKTSCGWGLPPTPKHGRWVGCIWFGQQQVVEALPSAIWTLWWCACMHTESKLWCWGRLHPPFPLCRFPLFKSPSAGGAVNHIGERKRQAPTLHLPSALWLQRVGDLN